MYIHSPLTETVLPVTFQAPNLRYLRLWRARIPIGSPLLTTTAGLVTLVLLDISASAYFPPSYIITRLSPMTQLETLSIGFQSLVTNRDVDRQLPQTTDMTTLPNLRVFVFLGTARYLEDLVARISAPSLNILRIRVHHFNQLSFTFPHLLPFMQTSENLTFSSVQVTFGAHSVSLHAVPPNRKLDTPLRRLEIVIICSRLDWQVASAVQFLGTLSPILSVVEQVAFGYEKQRRYQSSEDIDRRQWRELLRPFTNAKTIHLQDGLVSQIFRSLPSDDGEPPLELLPNLEEVGYYGESDARDTFTTFLNERQVAGHPISMRLVDYSMFDVDRSPLQLWT
jgi:hypothetical protein